MYLVTRQASRAASRAIHIPQHYRHIGTAAQQAAPIRHPHLCTITPSAAEVANMKLSSHNLQAALEAMHHDGMVAVEDVVDLGAIDALNEAMKRDTETLLARGKDGPYNYNLGNLQQSPPYDSELFAPSIFTNSIASQITRSFLGGRPTMSFVSSNVAVKAKEGQPVHSDADFAHPAVSHPQPIPVTVESS